MKGVPDVNSFTYLNNYYVSAAWSMQTLTENGSIPVHMALGKDQFRL